MSTYIHARLEPDRDDDLIDWLENQPKGRRSAAIRELLREGLHARSKQDELRILVREAVADALAGAQFVSAGSSQMADDSEIEILFGEKLDRMLDGLE
jgi:hypothetical protein